MVESKMSALLMSGSRRYRETKRGPRAQCVFIVSGGSRGLGKAIALEAAK